MGTYLTGDIHGNPERLGVHSFYEQKEFSKNKEDNYMIVLGDFGLIWNRDVESRQEKWWLDWLQDKPFTTLFVDGNHECVNSATDILTENGWINIKELFKQDKIKLATVDMSTRKIVYDYPLAKIKKYSDKIIDIIGVNYKQSATPNHEVIIDGKKVLAKDILNKIIYEEQLRYNIVEDEEGIGLSPQLIEILTAIVMDATIVDYNKKNPNSQKIRIQFHFKKQRKIAYIMNILDDAGINYTVRQGKKDDTYICIHGEQGRMLYNLLERKKELPYYFTKMNRKQFKSLFHALTQTDGTPRNNNVIWRTTSLNDVNIIQELCIKHNYDMSIKTIENASGYTKKGKLQYHCSFGFEKNLHRKITIQEREYNDYAYCFTMPQGTLITRYKYCSCITGNCFNRLYQYPVKEWNGGKVHEIRPNVLHLVRGEIFIIEDKKFFVMGGASSHDIQDGILDYEDPNWKEKAKKLDSKGKYMYRIKGLSWWEEEIPSDTELENGLKNLEKHNWKVDFILTHSPSTSQLYLLGGKGLYEPDKLTNYLEEVRVRTEYKRHFFGHMHVSKAINDKDIGLYEQIVRIN